MNMFDIAAANNATLLIDMAEHAFSQPGENGSSLDLLQPGSKAMFNLAPEDAKGQTPFVIHDNELWKPLAFVSECEMRGILPVLHYDPKFLEGNHLLPQNDLGFLRNTCKALTPSAKGKHQIATRSTRLYPRIKSEWCDMENGRNDHVVFITNTELSKPLAHDAVNADYHPQTGHQLCRVGIIAITLTAGFRASSITLSNLDKRFKRAETEELVPTRMLVVPQSQVPKRLDMAS